MDEAHLARRPRLFAPRVGVRDSGTWLHWIDEAFRATPARTWHSRSVWHRAVAARRHELRWMDADRMETLELAALLHDIGRALDPDDSEPHAFVGARFLDEVGLRDVAPLVAHHSGARHEAAERGMSHLDIWQSDPDLLALLTYFDRTTASTGESVTFEERRAAVAGRYGEGSAQMRWFHESLPLARHGESLLQRRAAVLVA